MIRLFQALGVGAAVVLLTGMQCDFKGGGDTSGVGDGGDGGGDDGGDGGATVDVDCDDPPTPDTIGGPDCVTRELSCGDSVLSTTQDGDSELAGDAYVGWYCAVVGKESYTGPERVFEFTHPGTEWVYFDLDTPCANLDLFVVRWEDDSCPTADYSILECEGGIETGSSDRVGVWNNEPSRYLLVVDGPYGDEEPFGLTVSCE